MQNYDTGVVVPLGSFRRKGSVRKAAPHRLAMVWAHSDVDAFLAELKSAGVLAVPLDPSDTADFLAVCGVPSLVVVDADQLDDRPVLDSIAAICERSGGLEVAVVSGSRSRSLALAKPRASA